jgi:demethylmacrocin O-methyltransferase
MTNNTVDEIRIAHQQLKEELSRMKSLDEIGIAHQTDKASQFSRTYAKPHNYLSHLEKFFEPWRYNPIKLLEVGCGGGESVRTWLEYFSVGKIYSVDLVSGTNEWNTPGAKTHERYTFACGDQSKPDFWKKFIEVNGGDWDIICDDGSHVESDIRTTWHSLWPHLKSGGIYEIEDLNYDSRTMAWMHRLVDMTHYGPPDIDSIYFARELCVMRKK